MKKNLIVLALILILALTITALAGCNLFAAKEKTFSKAGMSIVLTEAFVEKEAAGQTVAYESKKAVVMVVKEEFTLFQSLGVSTDISLQEYAELVISGGGLTGVSVEVKNGLTCFEYKKTVDGKDLSYFATVFRGSDAYWLIQFSAETKNYNGLLDTFITWAKSVSFS